MNILNQAQGENWTLANGDCIEVLNSLPENSIHLSIFSPPYASLYTYSNSDRDLGNSINDDQFYEHFAHVVAGLHRVTKPGRIVDGGAEIEVHDPARHYVSRAALKLHSRTVSLLHSIGAEDHYITWQFQQEAFLLVLKGTAQRSG